MVLEWVVEDGKKVIVTAVAAWEILEQTGPDPRFIAPWVMYAIQTGQVYRLTPDKVSKEELQRILKSLVDSAGSSEGTLSAPERQQLYGQFRGLPPHKVLFEMVQTLGIGSRGAPSGALARGVAQLFAGAGAGLLNLVKKPTDPAHRPLLSKLTADGRYALAVLNRVARLQ